MAAQRDEALRLRAVTTLEDPDDRGLKVVIPDPARNTTEIGEGQHVALQERFLRLGRERDVKCPARVRHSHHKHPALHDQTGDRRVEFTEINFSLSANQMRLRN